jgi:UDP-N-acetylglucosamine diphosphorylase / glucose-1-phosphate thymidylyltransferase / UDP-N-acetylgalactosamine diphosphorylase / glucosamine-1-phosphate N-acetyltransferase / galactosamine-1-phosphate N-acetyltransferase
LTTNYISKYNAYFQDFRSEKPWEVLAQLDMLLDKILASLPEGFVLYDGIAIHKSAFIDQGAIIKGPAYIGPHCYIGSNACLRGGVFLTREVKIGVGCEVKSSIVFDGSALAHFNFIGDSLIGSNVNFEAGSIIANHYNERTDKSIFVLWQGKKINTNVTKFGALVGDNTKIGANAVLSPGTLLPPNTIVNRLELIDQIPNLQ